MIDYVDYHIIDKCNLNCKGCSHFCPLVPKDSKPKSIEQITADLTLLSKFKDDIDCISLLGGEPTLHPELSKILRIARQIFPNNKICITTNGTTYKRILEWKDAIIENNISWVVTIYPYCDDVWERYNEMAKVIPNNISYWDFPYEHGFNTELLTNKNDILTHNEIINCYSRSRCRQLKDGKLYICFIAAQFPYLKDKFGDDINVDLDGTEYIDLNGDVTIDDIYRFTSTTHPKLCDHCSYLANNRYDGPTEPWSHTELQLDEWYKTK